MNFKQPSLLGSALKLVLITVPVYMTYSGGDGMGSLFKKLSNSALMSMACEIGEQK